VTDANITRLLIEAGIDETQAKLLLPGLHAIVTARVDAVLAQQGHVVITKNEAGQILAVTRNDDEGRVLSVISESTPNQPKESNHG
jgi:hypothetical protein